MDIRKAIQIVEAAALQPIEERYADQFRNVRGGECVLFKNPNRDEWKEINAGGDGARAFLLGDDAVVWVATQALHQEVRQHLSLPATAIPVMIYGTPGEPATVDVTDNTKNTPLWHDTEVGTLVMTHPYLEKMFGFVDVTYYDEDIVGDWANPEEEEEV